MSYPGTTLKGDEIRLIRLLPGQWLDEIRCILFDVHLNDNPQYEALSYVWGSARVKRTIRLNGQPHATTVNLESALRHLRHLRQELVLWVDALCIDQTNTDERTHQVNMMGRIYRNCKNAIVYFGDELGQTGRSKTAPPLIQFFDDERDLPHMKGFNQDLMGDNASDLRIASPKINALMVFSLMRILAQDQHFLDVPLFAERPQEQDSNTKRMLLLEGLRQFMHPSWTPWWSRIWVVQEVALPKAVTMVYGTVSAPWSMLARAASSLNHHISFCCPRAMEMIPRDQSKVLADFSKRILDITNLRLEHGDTKSHHDPVDNTSLLSLLRRFRNRKSTDLRDKIYALLALARDVEIVPDYTLSEQEVFRKATLEIIYASKSLSVLSTELGRKFRNDLPAWVPDWGAPGTYTDSTRSDAIKLYRAVTGAADRSTVKSIGAQSLRVEGAFIGVVAEVGEVMWGDSIESSKNTLWNWWKTLVKSATDVLDPKLTFWRLLCADVIFIEPTATRERRVDHFGYGSQELHTLRRAEVNDETVFLSWALTAPRSPFHGLNSCFPTFDKLNLVLTKLFIEHPKSQESLQAGRLPPFLQRIKIRVNNDMETSFLDMPEGYMKDMIKDMWRDSDRLYMEANLGLEGERTWREGLYTRETKSEQIEMLAWKEWHAQKENIEREEWFSLIDRLTREEDEWSARERRLTWEGRKQFFLYMVNNLDLITKKLDNGHDLNLASSQQEITAIDNAITSATLSRRLLITQDGHLCLGPAYTRVGDVLCNLKGGKTPFVLRCAEGSALAYTLVGDCYIQGMMDAESVDSRDWKEILLL